MADLSGHTILVVDDNDAGRCVKSRLLRQSGYRIIEVANARQTLALVRTEKPALVVLDVMLPEIDGLELCQRIKGEAETAHIMILLTSASRISTEDRVAGLETGADAYLTESIEPAELTTTVKVLLRLYDREEQNRRLLAELRTRDAEFRVSFENTSCGTAQAEPFTGKLLRVNRRFCEMLGYQEAELLGRSFIEFTYADDRPAIIADFTRLVQGEITEYRVEKRQVKKDGSFIWSEVTLNLVRNANHQPLRTMIVIAEISACKRHQEGRALLLEVTRAIIESAGADAVLAEVVFEKIHSHFDIDICFNYRLDAVAGVLRLVNSSGVPHQWLAVSQELAVGQAFCGMVAAEMTPLVADAERIGGDERGAMVRAMGVRAYACHPLTARNGAVLGTLSFASTRRDSFYADEVALMFEISHVLALAWERKQAEEALRHEREVLNLALLTGKMGVYDLDLAPERLWWSPETYALFGVPAESFTPTRESFMALVHPQDRAALCRQFNDIIERQELFNYEFRIIRADGTLRWIANRGQTEYDADGRPVRHLGIALDITERKSMEEIAQRWQRLFEESFFGLAHEDARSNSFVAVNRAFAEHRGYTVEELTGKPALTIYPVELRDQMSLSIRGADNHGHALFETVHQRKDGTTFPVLLEVTSIKDRAGQAHSRVAYALDISRLKTAEAALRQSEEQFRAFFESAVVGAAVYDPATGRFLKVNDAFCRMIGYSAEELSRLTPDQLTYPDDLDNLRQVAGRWHRGESESLQIDKRYQCKDGSPLWVRVNANLVHDGAGHALMGVAIIADINELKRIQFNSEFLLKLGRELGQLTDADEIGNTGVRAIAQYLKVSGCVLLTLDFASGCAEVNYQWFSDQRQLALSYSIGEFASQDLLEVLRRGEAVAIDDTDGDPRTRPHAAIFAAQGIRAFAAAPHRSEGVFEAVLTVSAAAPRPWSSDEVGCLQNVIARIWPAIKRARVVAELREREASLSASNQDLVRFNRAAVGRELRMIELKREINALCAAAGQPPRYTQSDPVDPAATGAEQPS